MVLHRGIDVNMWKTNFMKKIFFLLIIHSLCSGCSGLQNPNLLLRVPSLPTEKENLKNMIEAQLPEGATMIRPRNTNDVSTIRIADLNNDGLGEAIVFYETPDKDVRIHGMIFKNKGNTWLKVLEFDGEGIQLDRVELVDITGDNQLELIVGYGRSDSELNKGLIIYKFTITELIKLFEQPYSLFVIDDLDQTGINKLFITHNRIDQTPLLTAFQYQGKQLVKLHELEFNKEATSCTNMVAGFINKHRKGLVLDAAAGTNKYITDIIVLHNKHLMGSLLQVNVPVRHEDIPSFDINRDKIIEVAIPETPSGWESHEYYEIPHFTNYYQWDDKNGLKLVEKKYRDRMNRFEFTFPKSWYGRVTIDIKSNKEEMLRFIDIYTKEPRATIRFFHVEVWDYYKEKWTYLSSFGDKIIAIYSKEPLKMSKGPVTTPALPKNDN